MRYESKTVVAHGCTQILGMVLLSNAHIATLALDGYLKIWDCSIVNPKLKRTGFITSPYLHCFALTKHGLTVGIANGRILFVDPQSLDTVLSLKIHEDLPTGIEQLGNSYITSSIDGTVARFSYQSKEILQRIQMGRPLWGLKMFRQRIYLSANPACFMNIEGGVLENCQSPNPGVWRCFQSRGDVYATNWTSIKNLDTDAQFKQPCDILVTMGSKLLAVRQKQIGEVVQTSKGQMECHWQTMAKLLEGYQLRCAITIGNILYLGGDQGVIHTISLDETDTVSK